MLQRETILVIDMVKNNFNTEITYHHSNIDWDKHIQLLMEHRIFINAYPVLIRIIPEYYQKTVKDCYDSCIKKINNNVICLKNFAEEAKTEKLKFVLVKGLGIAKLIYGDIYARQASDLDILVEEDDMIRGDYILKKLGYKQPNIINFETKEYTELSYPIMRLKHTNHYFEYYKMDDEIWNKIELHKKLYFISKEFIDDFLWNITQIDIDNLQINVLNLDYSFIMLVANTYENSEALFSLQGYCRVREYIDLFNFIEKWKSELNWNLLKMLAKRYRLGKVFHKVFHNMSELYEEPTFLKYIEWLNVENPTENVESWNLDIPFADKMFDHELRRKEIRDLQKKKAFDSKKEKLKVYNEFDINHMERLKTIHNAKIEYQIVHFRDGLKLFVLLGDNVAVDIENYLFQLIVYNSRLEHDTLYSLLEISYEDGVVAYSLNTPILRDSNVLRKKDRGIRKPCSEHMTEKGLLIETEISYKDMGIYDKNCDFAIAFNWFKYMQPLTYHHMEPEASSLYESVVLEFAYRNVP